MQSHLERLGQDWTVDTERCPVQTGAYYHVTTEASGVAMHADLIRSRSAPCLNGICLEPAESSLVQRPNYVTAHGIINFRLGSDEQQTLKKSPARTLIPNSRNASEELLNSRIRRASNTRKETGKVGSCSAAAVLRERSTTYQSKQLFKYASRLAGQ